MWLRRMQTVPVAEWRSLLTSHYSKEPLLLMLTTREGSFDADALRPRGWTVRHRPTPGRERKTVRAYLADERVAGGRKPAGTQPFVPHLDYVRARLSEDRTCRR